MYNICECVILCVRRRRKRKREKRADFFLLSLSVDYRNLSVVVKGLE